MKSDFHNRYLRPGSRKQFLPCRRFLFDRRELRNLVVTLRLRKTLRVRRQITPVSEPLVRTERRKLYRRKRTILLKLFSFV